MPPLLLDSGCSNLFSSENIAELFQSWRDLIPPDLENRIIQFNIQRDIQEIREIADFLAYYGGITKNNGRVQSAVAEFFIDLFLQTIESKFEQISYIRGEPNTYIDKGGFRYYFLNTGTTIRVSNIIRNYGERCRLKPYSETPRIIQIHNNGYSHYVICNPSPKKLGFKPTRSMKALKKLLYPRGNSENSIFSYMLVYPLNLFEQALKFPMHATNGTESTSTFLERFLYHDKTNLFLVYSLNSGELRELGEKALSYLKK